MALRGSKILARSNILGQIGIFLFLTTVFYYLGQNSETLKQPGEVKFYATRASRSLNERNSSDNVMDAKERRLPTALIIGCMKCGTGTLQKFLSLHPSIAMAAREDIGFFNHYERGIAWYSQQMSLSYKHQITMEKSNYFGNVYANEDEYYIPKNVKHFNKKMKMIVIVREPVERCISHFTMDKIVHGKKLRNRTLEDEILDSVSGQVRPDSPYTSYSSYYHSMLRWLKHFPRKQFQILDASAFVRNPVSQLRKVERFLNISHLFTDDMFFYDKNKGFHCYINSKGDRECMNNTKGRKHINVLPETIQKLKNFFKPLNDKFKALTKQSFVWNDY